VAGCSSASSSVFAFDRGECKAAAPRGAKDVDDNDDEFAFPEAPRAHSV
jgi:hypothetical protein